ncbi:MAG: NUDIX domain-containing protein [Pseudomonadota bacterium]|nr:NUDIX domain-containing protein [Pseudomonadota bacterium]
MKNLIPGIRNAARAVIVRDAQILLLRKQGGGQGERFALPGGAQNLGETIAQALTRECQEEIGTAVGIVRLLYIADFFKHRDTDPPSRRQLLEILFECTVPSGYTPRNGYHPDKHQVEVVWMSVDDLPLINLLPGSLSAYLDASSGDTAGVYLGEIE